MRGTSLASMVFAALVISADAGTPALAQRAPLPRVLDGRCETTSHIAQGRLGSDLTQRQSRFFCDAAVVTVHERTALIQFSERRARHQDPVGFAGILERPDFLSVGRLYLRSGAAPVRVQDGGCRLFSGPEHPARSIADARHIVCGGVIDDGDWRTVVLIVFRAARNDARS
jgi:hypothetical protein